MSVICPKCGAENAGDGQGCPACAANRRRYWFLGGAIGLLALAVAGAGIHVASKPAATDSGKDTTLVAAGQATEEPVIRYNPAPVIVRQLPEIVESPIVARLPRGTKFEGIVITGADEKSLWLKLFDGSGYVAMGALSEDEPPKLVRSLGDRQWRSDAAVEILKLPERSAPQTARVAKGAAITLVGVTAGDFVEVRLANGSIGYVLGATGLLRRIAAKPVSLAFSPSTCHFGGEVDGVFARIGARMKAEWDAAEQKDYPTEEARNAAMAKIEGRSSYERVERSFEGLLLTAVGQHYESQSLYFADPPAKVIEMFRSKGFHIAGDGTFPSTELYAGIAAAQGDARRYGATDLGCGV